MDTLRSEGGTEQLAAIAKASRRVTLRPLSRADHPLFFSWRVDADNLHLWSSRKRIPSYGNQFEAIMRQTGCGPFELTHVAGHDVTDTAKLYP